MKCLHCGYCCIKYLVPIVKPEKVNEEVDLENIDNLTIKESDVVCPHLEKVADKYHCKIHHYKWYKYTPCFQFTQIESNKNDLCRIGKYLKQKNEKN